MNDNDKTKEQLIEEIRQLRHQLRVSCSQQSVFPADNRDHFIPLSGPLAELPAELLSLFSRFSVEISADEVFWMRDDSSIIYVNDSACKRLGYTREELQNMRVWEWDPQFTREVWEDFSKTVQNQKSMVFESCHRTKGGEVFPVEIKATMMEYEGAHYLFAFVNDISERQQLLKRLRDQNAQFEAIFNSISDGVVFVDSQRRIVMVNPAFSTITGYEQDEVVGRTMEFCYADTGVFHHQPNLFESRESGVESVAYQTEFRRKDDVIVIVDVIRGLVKDAKAEVVGALGVIRDVTARVKAEKELEDSRALLTASMSSMADGMMLSDKDGNLIDFNDAWVRFCRFENREDCLTSFHEYPLLFEIYDAEGQLCPPENWATSRALRGETGVNVEYRTRCKKSGESWIGSYSFSPVMNELNGIVGSLVIVRDITEQKQKEEDERHAEDRMRQARKMAAIGTLAGGIAHDFNNILSAIRGYADMAKVSTSSPVQLDDNLNQIIIASERARTLIKQILAFSRQSKVEPIALKIAPLIREGVKMLRSSIPATVSIVEYISVQNETVMIDPTQLYQVLLNLCTNAYQAMEQHGGILTVKLDSCDIAGSEAAGFFPVSPGGYVRLSISDTGAGIAADIVEKIFDPYFSTKEAGKGTGMGLAIVHGIMEECGGAVSVDTEPGKGTTFHAYFPLFHGQARDIVDENQAVPKGHERILFVDDEAVLVALGQSMLEWLGYRVTVQQSSLGAWDLFRADPDAYDLIMTDQTMPELTGVELSRRILELRPDMPIILCTGFSDSADEDTSKALGIREYMLKPLNIGIVARKIRSVLDETGSSS